jgi:Spy/CpxP family protein refolding chaperone
MKKVLLIMTVILFGVTAAMAQPQKEDQQKSKAEWEKKIKDELKLTEDQVAKFDAINKDYSAKIEAISKDAEASASKETHKEKKMALKKEKETKLMEILTPEQQVKYKELMEKKKKDLANKPGA